MKNKESLYAVNDVKNYTHKFKVGSTIIKDSPDSFYIGIDRNTNLLCYQWLEDIQVDYIGEL
jgi:hypothetical protein